MEEKEDSLENVVFVENLSGYLSSICEMRERANEDVGSDNQHFYFRGQANSHWEVIPSVYRGNLLGSEAQLIQSAYLRNPTEFRTFTSYFERLTKFQHYGLPTRLLDVTTNPFVALYFACQPYDEIQKNNEAGVEEVVSCDGAVFYKRAYGKGCQDLEIETVAFLASINMLGDFTLDKCLDLLEEKGIYSSSVAKQCRENMYSSLIQTLQNNYFVISTLNNERLIRQSGAFLVPGHCNIAIEPTDRGKSIIRRARGTLTNEFEEVRFIIPADKKLEILEELDMCNINEGALFPELEHQMAYIKQRRTFENVSRCDQFDKLSETEERKEQSVNMESPKEDEVEQVLNSVICTYVPMCYRDEILNVLRSDLCLDWYRKESVLGNMRLHIAKVLATMPDFDHRTAKQKAKILIDSIVEKLKA